VIVVDFDAQEKVSLQGDEVMKDVVSEAAK